MDDNYEGYHVDWSQAAKLLLDAEQPSTMAECLATAARTLSGVLSCSAVETKGGAFMVRSGSHAVVRRHLSAGGRDTIERLLAQDFGALEPELEPPTEVCAPAGSCVYYHPFLVHDRSENFRPAPLAAGCGGTCAPPCMFP